MHTDPHAVLAALADGSHVQIGGSCSRDGAYALYGALDSEVSGFTRDAKGRSRFTGPTYRHTVRGQEVRFYRVRHVVDGVPNPRHILGRSDNLTAEFGKVPVVGLRNLGKRAVTR